MLLRKLFDLLVWLALAAIVAFVVSAGNWLNGLHRIYWEHR